MQAFIDLADLGCMALFQIFGAGPALAFKADELAVVVADGAQAGHMFIVREFGAAGGAYRRWCVRAHYYFLLIMLSYCDIGLRK